MRVPLRTWSLWRLCAASLWISACTGTDHQLFEPIQAQLGPGVRPIPDSDDAGSMRQVSPVDPERRDASTEVQPDSDVDADPHLDPTVEFVWTETVPGQGTCKAGTYVGSFSCTGANGNVVTGQILVTLAGSPEEQRLQVAAGAVKDLTGAIFNSGMTGMLDCQTRQFLGETADGMSAFGPFTASLDGNFNDRDLSIEGTLLIDNAAKETCVGAFRISAAL